jgi:Arc/MetJ family transcription regulator
MATMLIDLDEELLAEAATALGTGTPTETVVAALRLVIQVARDRRPAADVR